MTRPGTSHTLGLLERLALQRWQDANPQEYAICERCDQWFADCYCVEVDGAADGEAAR